MKRKKRSTFDRLWLQFATSVARLVPLQLRKPYVRFARSLPRAVILSMAFTVLLALGATADKLMPVIFAIQGSTNDLWVSGEYAQSAYFECVVIQGTAMATMLGLLVAYATVGLAYLWRPTGTVRRTMLRIFAVAMLDAAIVCAFVPVNAVTATFLNQAARRENAESRVVHDWTLLKPETAARILRDEDARIWWETPSDGPIAREVKTELREGSKKNCHSLVLGLLGEAKWRKRGDAKLE